MTTPLTRGSAPKVSPPTATTSGLINSKNNKLAKVIPSPLKVTGLQLT